MIFAVVGADRKGFPAGVCVSSSPYVTVQSPSPNSYYPSLIDVDSGLDSQGSRVSERDYVPAKKSRMPFASAQTNLEELNCPFRLRGCQVII
jgi:hypothetical protein